MQNDWYGLDSNKKIKHSKAKENMILIISLFGSDYTSKSFWTLIFFSNYTLYLLYIISQHLLYSTLQRRAGRRTACTCSNHLDLKYSSVFIELNKLDITTIFLNIWSNATCDYLFYELNYLWIIGISLFWFLVMDSLHSWALSARIGIF